MWQKEKKYNSIVCLATLLTIASTPMAATFSVLEIAFAQTASSPNFPLPKTIPSGTTVKIDGSSSMARINESLKQSFEQQFSGTKVEVATNGTDAALNALSDGKVDLAAIGRGLTPAEQAKGLEQYRLRREKIAIVVGENNPFQGNLTDQQFAKIFRGEITDWSQIGGSKGKIRFIDRPTSSDTREAFRNYPVFKASNFAAGSTASPLSEDSSAELVKQLGKDGIGYVIANQVSKVPGLRILKLHNTLPSDPRYPFSQPLVYAYKNNPSAGVTGFLGFSTSDVGSKAQEAARNAEAQAVAQSLLVVPALTSTPAAVSTTAPATASPIEATTQPNLEVTSPAPAATNDAASNTTVSGTGNTVTGDNQTSSPNGENAVAISEAKSAGFPWWLWLLPIFALGAGLLWWLAGGKRARDEETLVAADGISGLPVANSPEVNINLPLSGRTPDRHLVDSAVTGAALAGGAVVGTGLWPRLTDAEDDDVSNQNIPPETEIPSTNIENSRDLEEPLAVVMPATYPGLPSVPQVDVDVEPTAIQEPVIDVELPNANVTPESGSNWIDQMTVAGGAALAGGTAAGAGLWSKFSNRDNEDESRDEETQLNPVTTNIWESNYPSQEVSQPSLETPEVVSTQMPDVWSETEEVQGDSNWREATNLGGAALAGGAVAGAGLWSKFANRDNEDEPNDTASIDEERNLMASANVSELSEVPHIPQVELAAADVDFPEVPHIPQVELAAADVDFPEVTNTPAIDVTQITEVPTVEAETLPEPLSDVWEDTSKDETQTGSNWLNDATLAGGAAVAGVAAAGAGLWSQFASQNQDSEVIDESISNREVIDTGRDDIGAFAVEDEIATEATINLDPSTLELVEDALESETPFHLDVPTDILVEDEAVINLDPSTLELAEEALESETSINLDVPTDILVEDEAAINLDPSIELVEPTEPVVNLEVPIEDASLSETNLVSGIGAAGGAVLVGGIASRDWWTPDSNSNDTDTESNVFNLDAEVPTEATPIKVIEITPADTSGTPEPSVDTPQYPNSLASITDELDTELPPISETAFNAVADAAEIPETEIEIVDKADTDVHQSTPESGINTTIAGGTAVATAGAALWSAMSNPSDNALRNVMETSNVAETPVIVPSIPPESTAHENPSPVVLPSIPSETASTINLNPRTPKWAYATWNIASDHRETLHQQGGNQLALRLYDVTNIDLSYQAPQLVQQYECEETITKRFVAIPISDRDYMTEIGYVTGDDRWLMIARSPITRIFSRPHQEFWFEADAELIIHGATEPGSTVTVGGHSVKLKPDGTFHLRIPFTEELIDYVMTAVANNSENAKTIHMHFSQEDRE